MAEQQEPFGYLVEDPNDGDNCRWTRERWKAENAQRDGWTVIPLALHAPPEALESSGYVARSSDGRERFIPARDVHAASVLEDAGWTVYPAPVVAPRDIPEGQCVPWLAALEREFSTTGRASDAAMACLIRTMLADEGVDAVLVAHDPQPPGAGGLVHCGWCGNDAPRCEVEAGVCPSCGRDSLRDRDWLKEAFAAAPARRATPAAVESKENDFHAFGNDEQVCQYCHDKPGEHDPVLGYTCNACRKELT